MRYTKKINDYIFFLCLDGHRWGTLPALVKNIIIIYEVRDSVKPPIWNTGELIGRCQPGVAGRGPQSPLKARPSRI